MEPKQREDEGLRGRQREAEAALLERLEVLERMVFGRTSPTNPDVQDLSTKVESIVKHVSRAEGGNRDLRDVAQLASSFGLLSPIAYAAAPVGETVALKESILLSSREEIEETAKMLSKVKALQEHINPPYLRDIHRLSRELNRMEGTYVGQAADAAWINERTENTRLHYSQAVSLISEKFVRWDDIVAELEREDGTQSREKVSSSVSGT